MVMVGRGARGLEKTSKHFICLQHGLLRTIARIAVHNTGMFYQAMATDIEASSTMVNGEAAIVISFKPSSDVSDVAYWTVTVPPAT